MTQPYMQFYPADYLADTMHLTLEEHGAYLKLLFCMWQAGGSLPNDDKKLCIILGIGQKKLEKIKAVLAPFFVWRNENFFSEKLSSVLNQAKNHQSQRSEAGKKSAEVRRLKNNETASTSVENSLQQNISAASTSRAVLRTPISNIGSEDKSSSPPKPPNETFNELLPIPDPPPDDRFDEFWKSYPPTNGSRKTALASYLKALKTGVTHDHLSHKLAEYRRYLDATGTPAAHASTWLNHDRWTVDYDAALAERQRIEAGNAKSSQPRRSDANPPRPSSWTDAGKQLAAKYLAEAHTERQGAAGAGAEPSLCAPESLRQNPSGAGHAGGGLLLGAVGVPDEPDSPRPQAVPSPEI